MELQIEIERFAERNIQNWTENYNECNRELLRIQWRSYKKTIEKCRECWRQI